MQTPYREYSTIPVTRLHIGFTEEQLTLINEAAKAAGLTRSAWLRELVDDTFRYA